MTTIGFIGLGVMGRPMAANLVAAGRAVFAHSRSGVPSELIDAGATECGSPREVAERAEQVILMVPDTPDVETVLFGADGVADAELGHKLVIDMSSISPLATVEFAQRVRGRGAEYLDAPVSGGETGARDASLTIMVGGTRTAFEAALPTLEQLGSNITLIGDTGAGQTAKVANQIIVALTIEAVGEALLFASRAGADPARVRAALMGGFASSRVLEVHGERMIGRSFQPGFRVDLHQKDLEIALQAARTLHLPLPATSIVQQLFSSAAAHGQGGRDHSALVTVLENLGGHQLGGDE